MAMSSQLTQQRLPAETQPRTYRPTLKGLLSLPFRICNPPPAVGKIRSCGVTPLFEVRLQDVLDRKHLPPLGLKDFEEWLVYVENCPENLYFILWLQEYTTRYYQWAASVKAQRDGVGEYHMDWSVPTSSQLAMFYARAKQTFFMPNSVYELHVPSDSLAPFHASDGSIHPDPLIFTEVALETRRSLERSLRRFVHAQLNNVGNNRVLCGIIAGTTFCLIGSVPPLAVNFAHGYARWSRLAAFPGMWIGLTILLAALNGICLGVYIFGDLRQLHKFELSRPPISKPQLLNSTRKRPVISLPISAPPPPPDPVVPLANPTRLPAVPPPVHIADHRLSRTSTVSSVVSSSSSSSSSGSSYDVAETMIHISPAFYDSDPVDGPATSPVAPDIHFTFPGKEECDTGLDSFSTAAFIHPYDSMVDDEYDYVSGKHLPEEHQPISAFDFDALPPRTPKNQKPPPPPTQFEYGILEIKSEVPPLSKSTFSPAAILERVQMRCNIKKWLVVTATSPPGPELSPRSSISPSIQHPLRPSHTSEKGEVVEAVVREHFKKVKAVPAFTSLTRILSPIVVRGQWEIVVRSAAISFMITWVILGSLLAVPPPR